MFMTSWFCDQDFAIAVDEHTARRRQRQAAHVIVFRHLAEALVMGDLEHPERHGECGKSRGQQILQHAEPKRQRPPVIRLHWL